jgi:hypothetical protein
MADFPIRIEVETAYLDHQSDPAEGRYAFSYSITIRNEGPARGAPAVAPLDHHRRRREACRKCVARAWSASSP